MGRSFLLKKGITYLPELIFNKIKGLLKTEQKTLQMNEKAVNKRFENLRSII